MNLEKPSRADLNTAWSEGLSAAKEGKSRAANPYIGKPDLAKNWDQGWKEG